MRYIFFGSWQFAAVILGKVIEAGLPPVALVCNLDKPVGRKQIITPPPTKQVVERIAHQDIQILQPQKIDEVFDAAIKELNSEFFVIATYGKIIPARTLSIPPKGTMGIHPSLLPKYRGASPIQSALLAGETETGVALFLLDEKVDHGPVIVERPCEILATDTNETLIQKLALLSADLFIETLPRFVSGIPEARVQDESQATLTKKFTPEEGFIGEAILEQACAGEDENAAVLIERKIKALNPEPGVWTFSTQMMFGTVPVHEKRVKLLGARLIEHAGKKTLKLMQVHIEGKRPMTI